MPQLTAGWPCTKSCKSGESCVDFVSCAKWMDTSYFVKDAGKAALYGTILKPYKSQPSTWNPTNDIKESLASNGTKFKSTKNVWSEEKTTMHFNNTDRDCDSQTFIETYHFSSPQPKHYLPSTFNWVHLFPRAAFHYPCSLATCTCPYSTGHNF